ncbi:MAG TPA: CAP domain-containing protein [Devosiaceae bacterium]|nr:CAP domain-containing protein [Devosiaceae bacterium]
MGLHRRRFIASAAGFVLAAAGPALGAAYVDVPVRGRTAATAINAIRARNGLGPLRPHGALEDAAADQARLMADLDQISHKLRGQSLSSRVRRAGYGGIAGENLSAGRADLDRVVEGWMNSPGHRRNMLDPRFSEFGIAAARVGSGRQSRYGIYGALLLGAPAGLPGGGGNGGGGLGFRVGRGFRFSIGG